MPASRTHAGLYEAEMKRKRCSVYGTAVVTLGAETGGPEVIETPSYKYNNSTYMKFYFYIYCPFIHDVVYRRSGYFRR